MGVDLDEFYQFNEKLSEYNDALPTDAVSFSKAVGWTVTDAESIKILSTEFQEKVPGGSEQKFKARYRVKAHLPKQRTIYNGRVTIFVNGESVHAGIYTELMVKKGFFDEKILKKLKPLCDYDGVDDHLSIVLPIVTNEQMSNNRVPCYFDNSGSEEVNEMLQYILVAGRKIGQLEGVIKN